MTWRAAAGRRLRIELDSHRNAHEVIERLGEVRGVFRAPGEHWYAGRIVHSGETTVRGVNVVRPGDSATQFLKTCSAESSDRICIMP